MVQIENSLLGPSGRSATESRPLYQVIVDDVVQKIHDGEYAPGDRLGSLGELCEHYDVSLATAHRSVGALATMGIVKTIPRKGAYVVGVPTPPAVEQAESIARVVLVESVNHRRERMSPTPIVGGFSQGTVEAIVRACRQQHIPLEFQFIPIDPSLAPRVFFSPRSGDAIIAIGAQVSVALLSHMATPNVPSVLVDAASPFAHCVLTDNYHGMYQIATHLHAHGHRRIALGGCFNTRVANSTNENERRDALVHHAGLLGMEAQVVESGEWEDLFATIDGPDRATAIVFTRDVAAVEFVKLARERGLDVPGDVSVVGFDDWATDEKIMAELTTVRVDVERLGEVAVEMVLDPPSGRSRLFRWRRVPPRLISRSSVAMIHP